MRATKSVCELHYNEFQIYKKMMIKHNDNNNKNNFTNEVAI